MISQPMTNETIVVLSTNGSNLSQTEKPHPTNQRQDSLKKYLKDEVSVIGVHGSLAGSILSTLSALVGFILLSVTLAAVTPASLECELDKNNRPTKAYSYFYYPDSYFMKDCIMAQTSLFGTLSLMLICTVLEFCLAVLTAVLWWKQAL
uniref:Membrane-spanning 4-domains subfamily A member 6E n=1 Tax=Prolemur simus TaxID=1328070 RepID=A0A8C9A7K4_PROSS